MEKDKIIKEQLKEIENQSKSIKNLSNLYESAIQYDKKITDFFSNITHDLKTPISVILGAIQLIEMKKSGYTDEQNKNHMNYQIIRHNCYRLLRLANNLLDFARLDSGFLKLNLTNCNIAYLSEEITQSVIPYAKQKQINIIFDTQHEEINTAVDIDKIERAILNLLSNAIKFTPAGGSIFVSVSSFTDIVSISIKDTGIGIPVDKQKEIFERFRQVNSKLSKDNEGSGIGLSLVKSFVELHKGIIKVSSIDNKGSEFIIELPIRHIEEHDGKPEDPAVTDRNVKIAEAANIEFSNSIAS
jgi:Signal transduction histidine kinase